MTTDPRAAEAIAILDAEATRRIAEIEQSIEFICSSLRAKGNMTINQLLESVRSLTMDEYCNKYHADTSYFLEEQARQRKGATMMAPGKKRSLRDVADSMENDGLSAKKKPTVTKSKQTSSSRSTPTSKSSTPTTAANSPMENRSMQSQQRSDVNHHPAPRKDVMDDEDEEEIDFGPLFMQFLRPGHPKVTFQFNPQEELDDNSAPRLQVPYEFVDQFGPGHRRRIADQVQHIQDQLESFKQRLLQPPSSSSSSS
ncbi:hypothetical protein [Absidia glauca]|uniref:Borealin N-terminal domain-containing protein n=1 Tax=Absidia glauca TaxID=4829 RepID=A0A168NVE1_ABSGL|nr:hypothetical protein [Absidia glauca]